MPTKPRKRRVGRPAKGGSGLSPEVVLDAALALLDEGGDGAVTFRALARALGVTPMAVSHHVGSRDEMFAALVDQVYAGVGDPPPSGPPVDRLRAMLEQYCERVVAHPNLVLHVFADPSRIAGPLLALTDAVHDALVDAGVDEDEREIVLSVIVDYTHGFAVSAAAYTDADAAERGAPPAQTLDDYRRGLDWILGRIALFAGSE